MSKSILIIDTPSHCGVCDLYDIDNTTYRDYCRATNNYLFSLDKPDWCPLKPLPKKMEGYDSIKWQWGEYEDGWNHCVDSILGE